MVEKHIEGEDYKVYVVGTEAIAAYTRTPVKIIGDGKHSVKELIDIRNKLRSENPHLRGSLLEIDEEVLFHLKKENLEFNTILPKGRVVFLRAKENVSVAGDLDDITNQAPAHMKTLAVKAIQSIPHLMNGSVDIRYDEVTCPDGSVIEINAMAQIAGHLFPSSGSPQDVTASIIDFYFPESIQAKGRNSDMFFNMKTIETYFEAFSESDYTLAPAPVQETSRCLVTVNGVFNLSETKNKLWNEARRLNLSGLITHASSVQMEIVLSGEQPDIDLYLESFDNGSFGATSLTIGNYDKPIVNGFYID